LATGVTRKFQVAESWRFSAASLLRRARVQRRNSASWKEELMLPYVT
jgi:hypothetical protein